MIHRGATIFREIVGITGNARQSPGGREPDPIYYLPYKQMPWAPPSVIVRATLPAATIVPEMRRIVAALDPQVPVHGVMTVNAIMSRGMAAPRLLTLLMSSFAVIGLLLTATGLYGLLFLRRIPAKAGDRRAHGARRQPWQHRVDDPWGAR